jgi:hypothetical protein
MLVTGYQLKEALKMKALELSTIQTQFDESLYRFEGEEKQHPKDVADAIRQLENEIVELQTAQDYYNLNVKVDVSGEQWSLCKAVKAVGGAGRVAKMWRTAAHGEKRDRWDRSRSMTRNKDDEIAIPTVTKPEALSEARAAEKFASQLRNAIAVGNTDTIEISWVTEKLFK